MKERPIPFSAPMVRALLDGRKTQTRRIVKPQPDVSIGWGDCTRLMFKSRKGANILNEAIDSPEPHLYLSLCPYGEVGDRLWVREAWRVSKKHDAMPPRDLVARKMTVMYEAGGYSNNDEEGWRTVDGPLMAPEWRGKYRPPMFMPRWASRITLEVTGVRVERLQDISEEDARAEGAPDYEEGVDAPMPEDGEYTWSYRASFQRLWESINGADSWTANPWVWVVEFKRAA